MSGFNPNFQQTGAGGFGNVNLRPSMGMSNQNQQAGLNPNLASIQPLPQGMNPGQGPSGGSQSGSQQNQNQHFNASHLQSLSDFHNRQAQGQGQGQGQRSNVNFPLSSQLQGQALGQGQGQGQGYNQYQPFGIANPGPPGNYGSPNLNVNAHGGSSPAFGAAMLPQLSHPPPAPPQQQQQYPNTTAPSFVHPTIKAAWTQYTPEQRLQILKKYQAMQMAQAARMNQTQGQGQGQGQSSGGGSLINQNQYRQSTQATQSPNLGAGPLPIPMPMPVPIQSAAMAVAQQAAMQRTGSMQQQLQHQGTGMGMQRTFSNQSNGGGDGSRAQYPMSSLQPNLSAPTQGPFAFDYSSNVPTSSASALSPPNNNVALLRNIHGAGTGSGIGHTPLTQMTDPSVFVNKRRNSAVLSPSGDGGGNDSSVVGSPATRPNTGTGTAKTPTPVSASAAAPAPSAGRLGTDQPPKKKRKKAPAAADKDKDVKPSMPISKANPTTAAAAAAATGSDSSSFDKTAPKPSKKKDKEKEREEKGLPVVYFNGVEPTKDKEKERVDERAAATTKTTTMISGASVETRVVSRDTGVAQGQGNNAGSAVIRPGANGATSATPAKPSGGVAGSSSSALAVTGNGAPVGSGAQMGAAKSAQDAASGDRQRRGGNGEGMRGSMRNEVARMMYAAGDVSDPGIDSVDYVEDLLVEFLSDLCRPPAPTRSLPGALHTQPPLTTALIRYRLSRSSHPSLTKYRNRLDYMMAMDVEITQQRRADAPTHQDLINTVGRDYLELGEDGQDAKVGGSGGKRGVKRGRPKRDQGGADGQGQGQGQGQEKKKPGPKKGWKRSQGQGDGVGAVGKKVVRRNWNRERSGTAAIKGEGA